MNQAVHSPTSTKRPRRLTERFWVLIGHPETLIGSIITAIWALLASGGNIWGASLLLVSLGVAYLIAVVTGSNLALWLVLFLMMGTIAIASVAQSGSQLLQLVFVGLGATSMLGQMQTVRIAQTRRRAAVVDDSVLWSPLLTVGLCALASVLAVAGSAFFAFSVDGWSWVWVPVATSVLFMLGFLLTILPSRKAVGTSERRWKPGARIPPAPTNSHNPGDSPPTGTISRF